tara:strand:+ start:203 stop:955 length:753 start_codon:yes stop_codon:yes gene_type:complete
MHEEYQRRLEEIKKVMDSQYQDNKHLAKYYGVIEQEFKNDTNGDLKPSNLVITLDMIMKASLSATKDEKKNIGEFLESIKPILTAPMPARKRADSEPIAPKVTQKGPPERKTRSAPAQIKIHNQSHQSLKIDDIKNKGEGACNEILSELRKKLYLIYDRGTIMKYTTSAGGDPVARKYLDIIDSRNKTEDKEEKKASDIIIVLDMMTIASPHTDDQHRMVEAIVRDHLHDAIMKDEKNNNNTPSTSRRPT